MNGGRGNRDRGASAVELALVLPVMLVIIFGIVDLARYVAVTASVQHAARESARFASAVGITSNGVPQYIDCAQLIDAGADFAVFTDLDPADFAVKYDRPPATTPLGTCPTPPAATSFQAGDRVIVTVTKDFSFITPFLGPLIGTVTVRSTDARTIGAQDL